MERKKTTEVNPSAWVPSNRIGLLPWAYKTFNRTRYGEEDPAAVAECVGKPENENCEVAPKRQRFFPHQRIVRDIIQLDSPYRGLLLFHSLGTGKSATSIASAEVFAARHRRIHILVPAALEANYRDEIKKYANVGRSFRGSWAEVMIDPSSEEDKDAYKMLQRVHRLNSDYFKTASGRAKEAGGAVFVVPSNKPDGLKAILAELLNSPELLRAQKQQSWIAADRLNWEKESRKLVSGLFSA